MVSGKYSALSGALAREQAINNLSSNLANINATGFKKDRLSFASVLQGTQQATEAGGINFARIRTVSTDYSQGGLETTGRSMDVAIDGEGFFKVQKNDETFYTRAGRLMVDETGKVKTQDGLSVLGGDNSPLQLDLSAGQDIVIAETGEISVNGSASGAKLQVFKFENREGLVKVGLSLYKFEGGEELPATGTRVIQGNLENSNINMMEEMASMITHQRAFEAQTKAIESFAKISEKQDELGSLS